MTNYKEKKPFVQQNFLREPQKKFFFNMRQVEN